MFSIFAIVVAILLLILIISCINDPGRRSKGYVESILAILGGSFSLYIFSDYLKYIPLVVIVCFVASKVDIKSLKTDQNLYVNKNTHTS